MNVGMGFLIVARNTAHVLVFGEGEMKEGGTSNHGKNGFLESTFPAAIQSKISVFVSLLVKTNMSVRMIILVLVRNVTYYVLVMEKDHMNAGITFLAIIQREKKSSSRGSNDFLE